MTHSMTVKTYGDKTYYLLGTAHVSQQSVADVLESIEEIRPQRVCIELDAGRYQSMREPDSWTRLDIYKVIKSGKGFLLMSNLLLSSYQKRMGLDLGSKPGAEMQAAIDKSNELAIPFSLIDREIATTLRRAWAKSSLWGKAKLMSALLSSAFGGDEIDAKSIEDLKKTSELSGMLDELSSYLPAIKKVLIDERDQWMASRLFELPDNSILAVLGAGHVPGMVARLDALHAAQATSDTTEIATVPPPSPWSKIAGWVIPIGIVGFLAYGFVSGGTEKGFANILTWLVFNGGGAALGTLLSLGHPLTIVVGFLAAPLSTLNPFLAVGMITGLVEAWIRKPRVSDLENLQTDITSLSGFYRNRVTRVLLVFILSSLGAIIGNIITFPLIAG